MMNVHTLNTVPREEWPHMSVQAVMIPRDKILWATPQEPLLELLERLLAADVNQMPVVSTTESPAAATDPNAEGGAGSPAALDPDAAVDVGETSHTNNAHIIGIVTRDSILRVIRTRTEVGAPIPAK
jgi:CBS domain-containing protein